MMKYIICMYTNIIITTAYICLILSHIFPCVMFHIFSILLIFHYFLHTLQHNLIYLCTLVYSDNGQVSLCMYIEDHVLLMKRKIAVPFCSAHHINLIWLSSLIYKLCLWTTNSLNSDMNMFYFLKLLTVCKTWLILASTNKYYSTMGD